MAQSSSTEVVITGIGLLSPIGIGADAYWQSIQDGRCGFKRTELVDFIATPGSIGGEISDFNASTAKKQHLKAVRKQIKVMCREIQLGVASALQAVQHAGITSDSVAPERVGVEFGANLMSSPPEVLMDAVAAASEGDDTPEFKYDKWGTCGDGRFRGMEPLWLLRYLPNMPGCHIGIAIDARGPNNSLTQDEASGGLVMAEAANIIRRDRADVMVVGTTGTRIHPVKASHHKIWDVLADGPAEERCRPFDRNRGGEVLAEMACSLILESREHAEARGATIYGTVLGTGASCVMGDNQRGSEQRAIEQAAGMALRNAGVCATDLGHVNACAAGHPERDAFEAAAIASILGDKVSEIPVTAVKSYIGSSGSGGALAELAASLLGLRNGVVPKTLNFAQADDATPIHVVSGQHLQVSNKLLLKTSVTRMGQATGIVVSA